MLSCPRTWLLIYSMGTIEMTGFLAQILVNVHCQVFILDTDRLDLFFSTKPSPLQNPTGYQLHGPDPKQPNSHHASGILQITPYR